MSGNDWWNITRMSLAVAGRKRQTVQNARHLPECSEDGGCDRKRATAGSWQTVLWDVQLQLEGRPQTATTWQAWYRNELVQIRWRQTVQHLGASLKLTRSGRRYAAIAVSLVRQTSRDVTSCDFIAADGARCPASATCTWSLVLLFVTTVTCVVE